MTSQTSYLLIAHNPTPSNHIINRLTSMHLFHRCVESAVMLLTAYPRLSLALILPLQPIYQIH